MAVLRAQIGGVLARRTDTSEKLSGSEPGSWSLTTEFGRGRQRQRHAGEVVRNLVE